MLQTPTIVFAEEPLNSGECSIRMKGVTIAKENSVVAAFACHIACYFVFNIKYPSSADSYCILAQIAALEMPRVMDGSRPHKLDLRGIKLMNKIQKS